MIGEPRILITVAFSFALAIACGEDSKDTASDAGNDAGNDTETDTDTWPDLTGKDCRFTVAAEPFEIKSVSAGHVAFPDVTRLPSGELLVVYRQASAHGVDPAGAIAGQFGTPDGLDWSPSQVMVDVPDVDDRDPSVTTLSDGSLALSYFQYHYQSTGDGELGVHQIFYSSSSDEGDTWSEPSMVPTAAGYAMDYPDAGIDDDELWKDGAGTPVMVSACSNQPVEIAGDIVIQNYGGFAWNTTNASAPRSRISLFSSGDDGATWTEEIIAPDASTDTWLQEPALLPLDDSRWIVHLRTADGASPGNGGTMWQIRTDDGGETWGEYEPFDFVGHAPFLYRLSNGVIVSAFRWLNSSFTSTNVNFVYSMDQGDTWSEVISVISPQVVEVGYPSIIELDGDRMLIVYYVGGVRIEGAIYDFGLVDL